jgi:hypothetical protein
MGDGGALAFQNASVALRGDKEVALAAIAIDGALLEFASDELRADKEVALAATVHDG